MDVELTLRQLARLEAERKLCSIPEAVLETAWVRDAQVEAVVDAVVAVSLGADARQVARARHLGEWSARIAAALPGGPEPRFARRVGVLSDVDPDALERITELRHAAPCVREYQSFVMGAAPEPSALTLIVAVAAEFDQRIAPDEKGRSASPAGAVRTMRAAADGALRPIVEALAVAVHPPSSARVVA